jgi:hypothetical protein
MNKRKNFLVVFSFLVVLVGSFVFSGCETSRVGPEVAKPNAQAPETPPVTLTGYVIDNTTGNGIANANVTLSKLDGTSLGTAVTNASGMYSFNLTALNTTETVFKVSTNVAGFGYGFTNATYNKTVGAAGAPNLVLTKIANVTTTTIGTTGGTATVPPTSDAKTTTPVTVTVPANAVPANTQVTLASVPVASTPPPTNPATQNIVSSNNLSAPGVTTFAQPVTMSFNLPFTLPVGTQIPLLKLNTTTGKWENTGLNSVVGANGVTATVQVTTPGSYALLGNVSVVQTVDGKFVGNDGISVTHLRKETGVKEIKIIELYPNNTTATFNGAVPTSPYITVKSGDANSQPTQAYSYGLVKAIFGQSNNPRGINYNFTYKWSDFAAQMNAAGTPVVTSGGQIQGPPGYTTTTGDWVYRITVEEVGILDVFTISQTGVFIQDASYPGYKYMVTAAWYWRVHNQGGIGQGPF